MTEKQFAEIIARALMMVLRAINRRYGLSMWILSRGEKRELRNMMTGETVSCVAVAKMFDMD